MSNYPLEVRVAATENATFALELLLTHLLSELSTADPAYAAAIEKGFDKAANSAEAFAIQQASTVRGQRSAAILALIEDYRSITLGERDRPQHNI